MNKRFNKGLFLDLDGTVITTKSGSEFPKDKYDWEFIPGVINRIAEYSREGYIICIVTNQGGIELGYQTSQDMIDKLNDITEVIETEIGYSVNTVFCPTMEGFHRKPNPGMAYTMALQLNIMLTESIMVGDAESDKGFAVNAGIPKFIWAKDFRENFNLIK